MSLGLTTQPGRSRSSHSCTVHADDIYAVNPLTAIFVARSPRSDDDLPPAASPLTFVDDSFSREPGYIDPELERRLKPYFVAAAESEAAPVEPPPAKWYAVRLLWVRRLLRWSSQ